MKTLFVAFLIALAGTVPAFARTPPLAGFWQGAVERDGKIRRVDFNIQKPGENYRALADFSGADDYAREFTVEQTGDSFRLERMQPGGAPVVFEGTISGGPIPPKNEISRASI